MSIRVSALHVYPLKSARGIALDTMELDRLGPRFDRRWMLIDDTGRFISQREIARLALIGTAVTDGALTVTAPDGTTLAIPPHDREAPRIRATIWDDTVDVVHISQDADAWFSDVLGQSCRLVYFPDDSVRIADVTFNPGGKEVGLADGFPLLIISEASLDELNERLAARGKDALPMNRFRPNIVVSGASAGAEDAWREISIGEGMRLSIVKPCARCAITTIDQATAERSKEPLATLATYRRGAEGAVLMAQNAIHLAPGVIRVGDEIEVLEQT